MRNQIHYSWSREAVTFRRGDAGALVLAMIRSTGLFAFVIFCLSRGHSCQIFGQAEMNRLQNDTKINRIQFGRDIRPILSGHCFACHGPDSKNQESDLRLDQPQKWNQLLDEEGHGIIAPGNPEKSDLIQRTESTDDDRMPPEDFGKPLSKQQIKLLRDWIKQGAKWEKHWAYRSFSEDSNFKKENIIDDLIDHSLRGNGWKRSPQAMPSVLIRRLYLDLTGLPPTIAQVEEFTQDPSENTYKKIVDRLLASPQHAEHLTSFWLDWVRFADTVGYHGDQQHAVWPYRDFVIQSFLLNRPYDEFSKLQIAGDLLTKESSFPRSSNGLIASCYNRLLQTTHEGGAQDKEYRAKYLADRVRNFSEVWLGSTMGCAECHDHKFDPFTQEDFYSLGAFFADVHEKGSYDKISPNATPTIRPPEKLVLSPLSFSSLTQLEQSSLAGILRGSKPKTAYSHQQSLADWRKQVATQKKFDQSLKKVIGQLNQQRKSRSESPILIGKCMVTRSVTPSIVRVLPRGDWMDDGGQVVSPRPPIHLGNWNRPNGRKPDRKDLAEWLFKKQNTIVARVMANRLWGMFFGKGLSSNLGDFGAQGSWPTHPVLLDRLSKEFQNSGWNIRKMIRLIVLSKTYQQNSDLNQEKFQKDPNNNLYWRQSPRRVRAETVRDIALASCDLLDKTIGGPSVKPHQPAGYYAHLNFPKRKYQPDVGTALYRRGLYIHWQRQFLHPMLKAFDAPSREECTAERTISNTPSAALVLLNDPTFLEAAKNLATNILIDQANSKKSNRESLQLAFQRILSRKPSNEELKTLLEILSKEIVVYKSKPKLAEKFLSTIHAGQVQEMDNLGISAHHLAGWTQVIRILLNLDETITIY